MLSMIYVQAGPVTESTIRWPWSPLEGEGPSSLQHHQAKQRRESSADMRLDDGRGARRHYHPPLPKRIPSGSQIESDRRRLTCALS